jgi:serine kinase of HPr protein (carbohydrate metabolism regulator)
MNRSPREGMPGDAVNLHGSTVALGDRGVLITGASGAGKTQLALALVAHWLQAGAFARLVSDDQTFVMPRHDRLVARAPVTIAGLAEVPGVGVANIQHEPACVLDLVVELAGKSPDDADRTLSATSIEGVELPLLRLPVRNVEASSMAISAIFGTFPFARQRHSAAIMLAIGND